QTTLDEPIERLLPGIAIPSRGDRKITPLDLATHTSGLPPMPANFVVRDSARPYADYTDANLTAFLATAQLTHDIRTHFEYSNLGASLLGFALTRRAGASYESLVRSRILDPLGMSDTRITMTPGMTERFAVGHDLSLHAVPHWDLSSSPFAPAGAWRS